MVFEVLCGDWGLLASLIFFHRWKRLGLSEKDKEEKKRACLQGAKEKEHVLFLQESIERQQINRQSHELARAATGEFWAQISI
mmetsp:Transcript_13722/g.21744  ORF Transcript_13722/g.21744 Transcript_13722/m.21744 type:complete len:83 (+) Transcript_13722:2339-2587(+)